MKDIRLKKEKSIDSFFGSILNSFIIFSKGFGKRKLKRNPKKILIYKLDAIGDSVISLPMIKTLKKQTNAKIILVCSNNNKQIFENQKFIDKIYALDNKNFSFKKMIKNIKKIKSENADISIDTGQTVNISAILSHIASKFSIGFKKPKKSLRDKVYDKSFEIDYKKHMFHNYMKLLSPLKIEYNKKPFLVKQKFSKETERKIDKILGNKKKLIGIHPFAYIKAKQWPLENFEEIINYLSNKSYTIVITGGPSEVEDSKKLLNELSSKTKKKVINLTGKLNLDELSAIAKKFKLFLANDGGPMHIAASMGIPVVGLFGYENPKRYAPLNEKSFPIYNVKDENHAQCAEKCLIEWPKCRNPKHINSITVKQVKEKIDKILK